MTNPEPLSDGMTASPPADDRERLRATFDQVAELYDRVRPGYPAEMFDDLAELAGVRAGARVLEIGPGTGQLTVPLAGLGCEIVGVELGAGMAAVARRKLAAYPSVSVVVAPFEDWPLPAEPFDAAVSATAFHWIDPAIRVAKSADALRPGGALATIGSDHIRGGDIGFFEQAQRCYERWDPATESGVRLVDAADIPADSEELDRSGRFEPAVFRSYEWEVPYTTADYIDRLLTSSGHRALESGARDGLLRCIAELIDGDYGGRITKRYLTRLRVARLRSAETPEG